MDKLNFSSSTPSCGSWTGKNPSMTQRKDIGIFNLSVDEMGRADREHGDVRFLTKTQLTMVTLISPASVFTVFLRSLLRTIVLSHRLSLALFTSKSGGLFLMTAENCPDQCGHTTSATRRDQGRFFSHENWCGIISVVGIRWFPYVFPLR